MCAVASPPGAGGVRVWVTMSGGRGPRGGRAVPGGVDVDYALRSHAPAHGETWSTEATHRE